FNYTLAVAGFAQLLKGAIYTGQWQYQESIDLAINNKGADQFGYRSEFIQLVRTVDELQ
ncbi:YfbK domain-containing protein, partial [Psychromonas aquatilis]